GLHQRLELRAPGRRLEIERHALLAEIPGLEILAVVLAQTIRTDLARRIAVRRLDLDHLGTKLGHEHRAVWPGAKLFQRQDPDAREWLGVAHADAFRRVHWRAMIRRCISLVPSPMQVSGASRYSRSMSYSLEYP